MSRYFALLEPGNSILAKGPYLQSEIEYEKMFTSNSLLLIAGGSGIMPIYQIIEGIYKKLQNICKDDFTNSFCLREILLIYSVTSLEDAWLLDKLEEMLSDIKSLLSKNFDQNYKTSIKANIIITGKDENYNSYIKSLEKLDIDQIKIQSTEYKPQRFIFEGTSKVESIDQTNFLGFTQKQSAKPKANQVIQVINHNKRIDLQNLKDWISPSFIEKIIDSPKIPLKSVYTSVCVICGPLGFNNTISSIMSDIKHINFDIFVLES
ncbi:hypothetical protein BB559_001623 [Furculomyces boomerangus]|uniref:Ferric reductase NAD binding domain-containing protein n=1 Tax=Furculomyces boomerangus TaxID=61424 RepID=A0A2T9XXT6_9FUNG|nr:hypothetical protein BB559_007310 [Furculomyces boomerangus]PVU98367.1 hypothetical protein BB559_001623 [Furculomyces boomerangus]